MAWILVSYFLVNYALMAHATISTSLTASIQPTSTVTTVSNTTAPPSTTELPPTEPPTTEPGSPSPSLKPDMVIKYAANMTMMDNLWSSNYSIVNSSEYNTLLSEIKKEIEGFFDKTGFLLKQLKHTTFMNQDGKVKARFTIAVSPKGGNYTIKHKDPILHWKEVVDEDGKIGHLNVNKESTKLSEEIPYGAIVKEWKTMAGECDPKCSGGVGPVAQSRSCTGVGCSSVLTKRWVTCVQGCTTSAGPNLVSSFYLLIATLLMILLI